MDPYSIIAQIPNAGQSFSDAFAKGQQQNALAAFAKNPSPQTAGPAARYDPSAVLSYNLQDKKDTATLSAQHLKDWHEYAGNLAKWADTSEKWDQAVDYLAQQGHPEVMSLKGHYDPAIRAQFMALGGVKDDNDPGIIREFQQAQQQSLIPQGTTFEQYLSMRNPSAQQPVVLPQNYSVVSGGQGGAGGGAQATPALRLNPKTGQWEPEGGAGGNASGGFPPR